MDPSATPWADVAELLRTQRQMARLSLRHLAKMTHVSDSYLSQVERGLYEPSPEVLKSIADALNLPISSLYERLGWLDDEPDGDRPVRCRGSSRPSRPTTSSPRPRSELCWRCIARSSERPERAYEATKRQARQVLDIPSRCVAY